MRVIHRHIPAQRLETPDSRSDAQQSQRSNKRFDVRKE